MSQQYPVSLCFGLISHVKCYILGSNQIFHVLPSITNIQDIRCLLQSGYCSGRDAEDAYEMQKARGKRISARDTAQTSSAYKMCLQTDPGLTSHQNLHSLFTVFSQITLSLRICHNI